MICFVRKPEFTYTYPKRNEWKDVRTAWFNAYIVTNNSGNCLPYVLLF